MNKLKQRWNITSSWQLCVIFIVFAITGSASAKLAAPLTQALGVLPGNWYYWPVRILAIFPIYQVILVAVGWLFGQFDFFWNFEKKMLRSMGLRFVK